MLKDLWKFILAVAHHWGVLVTGGVSIGVLGIWQGTGHSVPHWFYWSVSLVALFVAFFKAWRDEHKGKGALSHSSSEWDGLYAEQRRLKDELDILELPPPPKSIQDAPIGSFPSGIRLMTHGENYETQRRDQRIRNLQHSLRFIEQRLKKLDKQ